MTDDLVERLREFDSMDPCDVMTKAADRIEDLKVAIERIATYNPEITHAWAEDVREIARGALRESRNE